MKNRPDSLIIEQSQRCTKIINEFQRLSTCKVNFVVSAPAARKYKPAQQKIHS